MPSVDNESSGRAGQRQRWVGCWSGFRDWTFLLALLSFPNHMGSSAEHFAWEGYTLSHH